MDVLKIIKHLLQDLVLVENWTKFYFELELPGSEYVQLEQGFRNGTLSSFELFIKILTKWESLQEREATAKLCEILDELDFKMVAARIRDACLNNTCAGRLENDSADPGRIKSNITWPFRFGFVETVGNFFGRSSEMEELFKNFQTNSHFQMILISGLGGIGKTELAKKFATLVFRQENATCTLLNADTAATFRNTLVSLAEKLGLTLTQMCEKGTVDIFENVANLITRNLNSSKWLLILDNFDEEIEEVSSIIQIISQIDKVTVLVTSRNRSILGPEVLHLSLEGLEPSDAKNFIKSTLGVGNEDEIAIVELCQRLQNYPLALRQAVGYIKEQQRDSLLGAKFGVIDYLQKYEEESEELLGYQLSKFSDKYEKTTLLTWTVTMNKIKTYKFRTSGLDLLNILSNVNPNGISVRFFKILCKKVHRDTSSGIEEALVLLKKYSLIKVEELVIQIHVLVQKVIQISLKSNEMEVSFINELMLGVIGSRYQLKVEDFPSVVKIYETLRNTDQFGGKFLVVPQIISNSMIVCGVYRESLSFTMKNYEWLKEKYSDTNEHVLKLKLNIARCLRLVGKFEEALEIIHEVNEDMKIYIGANSQDTLDAAHTTSRILLDLGKYEDALKMCHSVIQTQTRVSHHQDKRRHNALQVKAKVMFELKQYDEAMNIYKQVVDWQMKHHDEHNWRRTLTAMHGIGICQRFHGKYTPAKEILQKVVRLRCKTIGELHPDTLHAKYDLAITLCSLMENEKGLIVLKQVWKSQCKVLGDEDFRTKMTAEQIERVSLYIENVRSDTSGSS